jgi:hypothetical protein
MLSVASTIHCRIIGRLIPELERMWKDAFVALISPHLLERLRRATKELVILAGIRIGRSAAPSSDKINPPIYLPPHRQIPREMPRAPEPPHP